MYAETRIDNNRRCSLRIDQVGLDGILTWAVDLDSLPEAIQPRWRAQVDQANPGESGKPKPLMIGLADGYDLLAALGHPTGLAWEQRRSELVNAIKTRNDSLFAHGFRPVDYGAWRELSGLLGGFLQEAIQRHAAAHAGRSVATLSLPQLPTSLAELLPAD